MIETNSFKVLKYILLCEYNTHLLQKSFVESCINEHNSCFVFFLLCSTLQGSDTANSFSVYGREVEIITSKPNEAASSQAKTGSNKVKIMVM